MLVNLPQSFTSTIVNAFGDRGRLFLRSLPGLLDEAARRWGLDDLQPAAELSYNYIVFARRGSSDVVLKLGVPDREFRSGIRALRQFDGRGAVRILESDSGRGMLLLERLRPGAHLAALANDDQITQIAGGLMLALRRPSPPDDGLIPLEEWLKGFDRLRQHSANRTLLPDGDLMQRAADTAARLMTEHYTPQLIHGDLHHFNILSSDRGWLAIDPKGLVGPAEYELGPFLINPWLVTGLEANTGALMDRRIALLAERLGASRRRIREWGLVHAALSALWSLEEKRDWHNAIECAQILSRARD